MAVVLYLFLNQATLCKPNFQIKIDIGLGNIRTNIMRKVGDVVLYTTLHIIGQIRSRQQV